MYIYICIHTYIHIQAHIPIYAQIYIKQAGKKCQKMREERKEKKNKKNIHKRHGHKYCIEKTILLQFSWLYCIWRDMSGIWSFRIL